MSAVIDDGIEIISTQTAPSGPVDKEYHRIVAGNTSELYVVSNIRFVDGIHVSKVLGAYWNRDTAKTVAGMFAGEVTPIQIGAIPQINRLDIH